MLHGGKHMFHIKVTALTIAFIMEMALLYRGFSHRLHRHTSYIYPTRLPRHNQMAITFGAPTCNPKNGRGCRRW